MIVFVFFTVLIIAFIGVLAVPYFNDIGTKVSNYLEDEEDEENVKGEEK